MKFSCGFRRDFALYFDHSFYDGNWYTLSLGWVWLSLYS